MGKALRATQGNVFTVYKNQGMEANSVFLPQMAQMTQILGTPFQVMYLQIDVPGMLAQASA